MKGIRFRENNFAERTDFLTKAVLRCAEKFNISLLQMTENTNRKERGKTALSVVRVRFLKRTKFY